MNVKKFADTLVLWTFVLLWASVPRTRASGQPRVIGSPWPTTATPGDDVILPCHLEPRTDARALTVEWSRPDLSDQLRRGEYVFLRRGGRELTDMKMAAYAGRASLLAGDLKHGNLSLRIGNVTHADGGRYKCFVPKLWSHAIVLLVVDPNFVRDWTTASPLHPSNFLTPKPEDERDANDRWTRHMWILPVVVIAVTLLATGLALSLTRKHLQPDHVKNDDAQSKPLAA